jgi:serine protease Do
VANLPPGKTSQITVLRDGDRKRISVTIGQRPTQVAKGKAIQEDLGFQLMNLTDEVRERFQIPDNVDGVLVAQVVPGSEAHQAGLRTGAVITEVNRQTVQSVGEFNRIFNQVESGKNVLMLVYYQGGTVYMVIPKPEK